MPVNKTKLSNLKKNLRQTFNEISEKKAKQFVNGAISIGVNHSKELTPIAYSNLINSIVTEVKISNSSVTGTVSYMAEYAVYLNGTDTYTPLWKPVPLPKYEVKGIGTPKQRKEGNIPAASAGAPATNMNAKPRFLNRGFEDQESATLIENLKEKIFKI